jgi:cation diffusion facilitator family transporter
MAGVDDGPVRPAETVSAGSGEAETVGVVLVAGLANLGIAVAKLVAGLLTGSASMLSEALHSVADTVTEVLLFAAMKHSARPPDARHPLGYGRAAFAWALLASVATFTLGGGFAIAHGLHEMSDPEPPQGVAIGLAVLAVSAALEVVSLRRSRRESRSRASRWRTSEAEYLHRTSDTALRAVLLEDVIALVGLGIAALGLLASQLSGSAFWDGLGSVVIGLLLVATAVLLGTRNLSLLLGRSAPAGVVAAIAGEIAAVPGVDGVAGVVTEATGPGRYLVLARVRFDAGLAADEVAGTSAEAVARVRGVVPVVGAVYLHPEPGGPAGRGADPSLRAV